MCDIVRTRLFYTGGRLTASAETFKQLGPIQVGVPADGYLQMADARTFCLVMSYALSPRLSWIVYTYIRRVYVAIMSQIIHPISPSSQLLMSQVYAKSQPEGFTNRIEKVAIVGVSA